MAENAQVQINLAKRIASIDALRGFDMFWITGGEEIIHAIHDTVPSGVTTAVDAQFQHMPWAGFHFYDLISPLFIFVVGAVLPFSLAKRLEANTNRAALYLHLLKRLVLLFLLGLVHNGLLDFDFHNLRIAGVLQRIAISYFVAALVVVKFSKRGQACVLGGILLGYWAVMMLIPVPGFGPGVLTPQGNLASFIDRHLLPGSYCCFTFGDNEGIFSTIPAIGTALMGVLAGQWLRSGHSPNRKTLGLALAGIASLIVGLIWSVNFPIIKNLWTSTFVLVAGGWSLLLLAFFYWIIDARGYQRWAFFFKIIGVNAITIYLVWNLFKFGTVTFIFVHGFIAYLGPAEPIFWAVSVTMTAWLFLYFLYKQKIFLRI